MHGRLAFPPQSGWLPHVKFYWQGPVGVAPTCGIEHRTEPARFGAQLRSTSMSGVLLSWKFSRPSILHRLFCCDRRSGGHLCGIGRMTVASYSCYRVSHCTDVLVANAARINRRVPRHASSIPRSSSSSFPSVLWMYDWI